MGRRYLPLDLRSILVILVAVVQYVYSMDLFYSGQFEACTNVTLEWLGGAAPYNISFVVGNSVTEAVYLNFQTNSTIILWYINVDSGFNVVIDVNDSSVPPQNVKVETGIQPGNATCDPSTLYSPLHNSPSPTIWLVPPSDTASPSASTTSPSASTTSPSASTTATTTSSTQTSLTGSPTVSTTSPSSLPSQTPASDRSDTSKIGPAVYIGIIIGLFGLICLAALAFILCRKRQKRRRARQSLDLLSEGHSRSAPIPNSDMQTVHPGVTIQRNQSQLFNPNLEVESRSLLVQSQGTPTHSELSMIPRDGALSSPSQTTSSFLTPSEINSSQVSSSRSKQTDVVTRPTRRLVDRGGSMAMSDDGDTSATSFITRREADGGITLAGGPAKEVAEVVLPPAYGEF